jgi:hypothetical protein
MPSLCKAGIEVLGFLLLFVFGEYFGWVNVSLTFSIYVRHTNINDVVSVTLP